MSHSWDEIKEIIERIETDKLARSLSRLEQQEGVVSFQSSLTDRSTGYMGFLGGLSLGIGVGVLTMIFNYMLFVWLLHIEF